MTTMIHTARQGRAIPTVPISDCAVKPFRDLDVALLIEHAHGAPMAELMAAMFAEHPRVVTGPSLDVPA
jgi:hypothetical protein